ncbi:hypothetical protein VIGAN_01259000, partial [Vigna angularis var. angularis]
ISKPDFRQKNDRLQSILLFIVLKIRHSGVIQQKVAFKLYLITLSTWRRCVFSHCLRKNKAPFTCVFSHCFCREYFFSNLHSYESHVSSCPFARFIFRCKFKLSTQQDN